MLFQLSTAGAFLGGVLALLSPCSALLLPAFFAYAFKSKRALVSRTLIFLLGLATLLVPLGMGASWAGALVMDHRWSSIRVAGLVLVGLGLLELSGRGFSLVPQRLAARRMDGTWVSAYLMGLVYGFSGICSGPILGAVLTMAAATTDPWHGALLLLAYAAGMAVPLFILALFWDRYDLGSRSWLRGRLWRWGRWQVHTTQLVTGGLFLFLGLAFWWSEGTVAFESLYARLGLLRLSMNWQQAIMMGTGPVSGGPGIWGWGLAVLAVAAAVVMAVRWRRGAAPAGRHRKRGPGDGAVSRPGTGPS